MMDCTIALPHPRANKWLVNVSGLALCASITLQGVSDIPRTPAIDIVPLKSEADQIWWLNPALISDDIGAQDAYFYVWGLPFGAGMQSHMFASLRHELFWAQFGREWAYKGTSKTFAALLALHGADPIFRQALPETEQSRLAAIDEQANLLRAEAIKRIPDRADYMNGAHLPKEYAGFLYDSIKAQHGVAAAAMFLASVSQANAWTHGSGGAPAPPATCPMGTFTNSDGVSDGCPGAPTGTVNNITLFQHTDFFTPNGSFPSNGGYYNNDVGHTVYFRPPWNVAGVDYPSGIDSSTTFYDPATLASVTPPHTGTVSCAYSATGSAFSTPQGSCTSTGSATLTPTGMDFSGILIGSHTAVDFGLDWQFAQMNCLSCFVMFDSFNYGKSNILPGGGGTVQSVYQISTVHGSPAQGLNTNYSNTVQRGFQPPSPSYYTLNMALIQTSASAPTGTPTADPTQFTRYNVYNGTPGNPADGGSCSIDDAYAYVEGWGLAPGVHGEYMSNKGCEGTIAAPFLHHRTWYYFNTIYLPSWMTFSSTTILWFSNGTHYYNVDLLDPRAKNNTQVQQKIVAQGKGPAAFVGAVYDLINTNPQNQDNYVDAQGQQYNQTNGLCNQPLLISGNFDISFPNASQPAGVNQFSDGVPTSTTASESGTTLTVTQMATFTNSIQNNTAYQDFLPLQLSMWLTKSGLTNTQILSQSSSAILGGTWNASISTTAGVSTMHVDLASLVGGISVNTSFGYSGSTNGLMVTADLGGGNYTLSRNVGTVAAGTAMSSKNAGSATSVTLSANTFTITGTVSGAILANGLNTHGMFISGPGITPARVMSYNSGTKVGTFSGPTQAVGPVTVSFGGDGGPGVYTMSVNQNFGSQSLSGVSGCAL